MKTKLALILLLSLFAQPVFVTAFDSSYTYSSSYITTDSGTVAGGATSSYSGSSYQSATANTGDGKANTADGVNNSGSSMSQADGVNDAANASYVPAACGNYIVNYITIGGNNNTQDVKNLQTFLNTKQGEKLVVDGVYKDVDIAAVKRFQLKYIDTLKFWGLTEPTGQVLQTTINKINTIHCENNQNLTCPYFGSYQKLGSASNEVVKIKKFLNNTQGENLDINSNKFDDALFAAVKRFQSKYLNTALKPWGITEATGFWYQSTRKTAHDVIGCYEAVRLDNGVVLR